MGASFPSNRWEPLCIGSHNYALALEKEQRESSFLARSRGYINGSVNYPSLSGSINFMPRDWFERKKNVVSETTGRKVCNTIAESWNPTLVNLSLTTAIQVTSSLHWSCSLVPARRYCVWGWGVGVGGSGCWLVFLLSKASFTDL